MGRNELLVLRDRLLRSWDVDTAAARWDVTVPLGTNQETLTAAGDMIAVVSHGIELRDAANGRLRKTLPVDTGVSFAAFVDANTLALNDMTAKVALVEVTTGVERSLLELGELSECLAAGGGLVAACRGSRVITWDARGHPGPVFETNAVIRALAVSNTRVAAKTDHAIRVFARKDGRLESELPSDPYAVVLALSADGSRLAVARNDGVQVYALPSGKRLHTQRPRAGVRALAFGAGGQKITARGDDGSVRAWQLADGAEVAAEATELPMTAPCKGWPGWQMSPDCRAGVLTGRRSDVRIWRAARGTQFVRMDGRSIVSAAFAGSVVALTELPRPVCGPLTGCKSSCVFYVVDEHGVRWRRGTEGSCVGRPVWSPGGDLLAVGTEDAVLFFAANDGHSARAPLPAPARALAFSPDGARVAAGLGDGTVALLAPPAAATPAERLIEDLNFWVRGGGDPEHRPPDMSSTGEANAAFIEVKRRLEALHVAYAWDGTRYVLKRAE